jgi:WXG100 family type VII secretion target
MQMQGEKGGNGMPSFIQTRVDPDRLSTIANSINENISQVETAINRAQQALTGGGGSLRATWTGPASTQFYSQYDLDMELFSSHLNVLKTLNNQLREAAGIFNSADNRAQELVNGLKIG